MPRVGVFQCNRKYFNIKSVSLWDKVQDCPCPGVSPRSEKCFWGWQRSWQTARKTWNGDLFLFLSCKQYVTHNLTVVSKNLANLSEHFLAHSFVFCFVWNNKHRRCWHWLCCHCRKHNSSEIQQPWTRWTGVTALHKKRMTDTIYICLGVAETTSILMNNYCSNTDGLRHRHHRETSSEGICGKAVNCFSHRGRCCTSGPGGDGNWKWFIPAAVQRLWVWLSSGSLWFI